MKTKLLLLSTIILLTSLTLTLQLVTASTERATLSIGDERKFEITNDDYYDLSIRLDAIKNDEADITVKSINELITPIAIKETSTNEETSKIYNWAIGIILGIITIIIITLGPYTSKKK